MKTLHVMELALVAGGVDVEGVVDDVSTDVKDVSADVKEELDNFFEKVAEIWD